jgi:hypothetical protein
MQKLNLRLNNFMKNSMVLRAALYFLIAAIPTFMTDLSKYKSFAEISGITVTVMACNFILQGFIALRAFLDQSISRATESRKNDKNVELLKG